MSQEQPIPDYIKVEEGDIPQLSVNEDEMRNVLDAEDNQFWKEEDIISLSNSLTELNDTISQKVTAAKDKIQGEPFLTRWQLGGTIDSSANTLASKVAEKLEKVLNTVDYDPDRAEKEENYSVMSDVTKKIEAFNSKLSLSTNDSMLANSQIAKDFADNL